MDKHIQHIVTADSTIDFITISAQICIYLNELEQSKKRDFIDKMLFFLPLLYAKARQIPPLSPSMDGEPEQFLSEAEYIIIRNKIESILGSDDAYLEVFMEDIRYSDEPITAFISENIADIYQELENLIGNWQIENDYVRNDALVVCIDGFKEHWGQKLLNVMRPLHALSLDSYE